MIEELAKGRSLSLWFVRPCPGLRLRDDAPSSWSATRLLPALQQRSPGVAAASGGYGWRSGRRTRAARTGPGRRGPPAARTGREKMVRTAKVQAHPHRQARIAARREAMLVTGADTLLANSTCPSGFAVIIQNRAIPSTVALKRLAGLDLRIPSPNIALAPFAASPPSPRTGRGSVPLDRRDVEAGPGAKSFTWPTKCLSTHLIPRRPGLWCCAGTA